MLRGHVQDVVAAIVSGRRDLPLVLDVVELQLQHLFVASLGVLYQLIGLLSLHQGQALLLVADVLLVLDVERLLPLLLQLVGGLDVPGCERLAGLVVARHVEGRLSLPVLEARVGSSLEQQLHHLAVALEGRAVQRGPPVAALGVGVAPDGRPPVQDVAHGLEVALHRGLGERAVAAAVLGHEVRALLQERLDLLQLAVEGELEQVGVHLQLLLRLRLPRLLAARPDARVLFHLLLRDLQLQHDELVHQIRGWLLTL
mmetsp:Transcript_24331/g.69401  ORF Transcript_24331/g.69401 Transcript_24331/m.69401 type:complete len:257 (+) Transcript_24331:1315-2085(+)